MENRDQPLGLMIRRSLVTGEKEIKFYLSNAPETISLDEMAWAGCQRWSIEVDFKLVIYCHDHDHGKASVKRLR